MKLPVAIQTALERSERKFQTILARLGLTREQLARVAEKIQTKTPPRSNPAASIKRRVIHV